LSADLTTCLHPVYGRNVESVREKPERHQADNRLIFAITATSQCRVLVGPWLASSLLEEQYGRSYEQHQDEGRLCDA
jgi:hypothetical protein